MKQRNCKTCSQPLPKPVRKAPTRAQRREAARICMQLARHLEDTAPVLRGAIGWLVDAAETLKDKEI